MAEAISNTSPLFYLYQIGALDWLPRLFSGIWISNAVVQELAAGKRQGCDVPDPRAYRWLRVADPQRLPSEWLALDLGPGELSALALGLENRERTVLLDDALARRIAHSAGLTVWGTLRVLLEGKRLGLAPQIAPLVDRLQASGMWISADIRRRVLALAKEAEN
jgi:predicted nucleic acid-binding protein